MLQTLCNFDIFVIILGAEVGHSVTHAALSDTTVENVLYCPNNCFYNKDTSLATKNSFLKYFLNFRINYFVASSCVFTGHLWIGRTLNFLLWNFSEIKCTWDDPEKSLISLHDQLRRHVEELTGGSDLSGVSVHSYTTGSDQATVVTSVDSLRAMLLDYQNIFREKSEGHGFPLKVSEHRM